MTALTEVRESQLTMEDREASFQAGYELGRAERVDVEIEDQIQSRLHARALEALGMAHSAAIHGPAFSAMVRESNERDE